ncbi:MAG: aminodeoxychorismate synthase component I [Gammaproteobacteria bacterium]|nr:aminodeoxychorismate synthase component I [Gammaproteobacteria bacterium]MCW8958543.1 aminodeoxychorismate synthase component I [Gammaproteobacteria bacterium]MCW8972418.1 aminodeoxychorismate synthase component I [Gammaproteobacteria bacterium]MCW8992232.1 aminodeoxychorismate synthase component I [Gammaproteobacteria bacterium]MCW9088494.1 aminodeoxychorismate synthase component I [Gammaproteobacteria bacterium]
MSRLLKSEIPFPDGSGISQLFEPLAGRPWSAWLDSGTASAATAGFDILVADPVKTLVTRHGMTTITSAEGETLSSGDDPFDLLRTALGPREPVDLEGIPFAGGAVGYFGYDLARLLERLPEVACDDLGMPEMAVGIYEWAVVCDRGERRCWLVSSQYGDERSPQWQRLLERFGRECQGKIYPSGPPMQATAPVEVNMSRERYAHAFDRIQHYLEEGDCYQVNLAQRFSLAVEGDAWEGYKQFRQRSAGPFSAYLDLPGGQILCTSPERFLRLEQGRVETRPIKGTRRRDPEAARDAELSTELQCSEKDRAENLMIVDLLRNDLGKSCRTGTVRVPQLFQLESFATVHHLVSSVVCELGEGQDALSLLRGCFPGGSITGAPKLRAMAIIEELEPHRRGVYCGSIGYIGFNGEMDSNIVIRTAIHREGRLYYSAGGGIVRDSSCEEEYQESFDKAAAFLNCFSQ